MPIFYSAVNSPLQEATALVGFEDAEKEKYFSTQIEEYTERRTILCEALDKLGLAYTLPDGAYFILVQNERIKLPKDFVIPDLVCLACLSG
jgi:kynurenine aminotransferase